MKNDAAAELLGRLWYAWHGRHTDEERAGTTSQNGGWNGELPATIHHATVSDSSQHASTILVSESHGEKPQLQPV